MASTALFGSTGLVGEHILHALLGSEAVSAVHTVSRRAPKLEAPPAKLHATVDAATEQWPSKIASLTPPASAVFSALGTTRATAGGIANQWKIDHDLNVEIARAAKAAGARTFVFVSSGGTRGPLASSTPYAKMKNGVEDAVKGLAFDHAVILKPGLIVGQREQPRAGERIFGGVINALGWVSTAAKDYLEQDALVIGRAAVAAALLAEEGKAPEKYWVLGPKDIIRLGKTEWKA